MSVAFVRVLGGGVGGVGGVQAAAGRPGRIERFATRRRCFLPLATSRYICLIEPNAAAIRFVLFIRLGLLSRAPERPSVHALPCRHSLNSLGCDLTDVSNVLGPRCCTRRVGACTAAAAAAAAAAACGNNDSPSEASGSSRAAEVTHDTMKCTAAAVTFLRSRTTTTTTEYNNLQ